MSADQYDRIGASYDAFKALPMARYAEIPGFTAWLGDVKGRKVLDAACGTGFYTRHVKALGAAEVVGVDVSPAMVAAARAREERAPVGVRYETADAADMSPAGAPFDLVCAAFLLNYADGARTLARMCAGIRAVLADGGELRALTQNPGYRFDGPDSEKYGFRHEVLARGEEGARVRLTALLDDPLSVTVHFLRREVYESALRSAGFTAVVWEPVPVDQSGIEAFGAPFWQDWRDNPSLVLLRCRAE
ncbi:class I SAM-dependent methyltransferase [Kitasatospora phosalacinea]|uniref:class I SAM-dependent methyltransferase n=1 Tax=Kitasatospora phosalacinea TaxID=2065 RepID=UPI00365E0F2C